MSQTEATAIPAEHLSETDVWGLVMKRAKRLDMAFRLFCSKVSGQVTTNGNTAELRAWCWRQADVFLEESGHPPAQAAACESVVPAAADQRRYLEWLANDKGGSCLTAEAPTGPDWTPRLAADCRRALLKRGLIASEGGGYAMTAQGWNSLDPLPRGGVLVNGGPHADDSVRLAEIDDAA